MSIKNQRGPLYGAIGAAAALAVCGGAMVLAPVAVSSGTASQGHAATVLAKRQPLADGTTFLQKEEAQGGDCTLTVPADPLTAQGLATPYQLSNGPGPHPTGPCTMANAANLGAFVQATILEPGGKLFAYDPLVITAGTTPAAAPPVPAIPAGSVVTIDTGFQGNIDFLQGPGAGAFVQGLPGSPFGQVAFANGPAFFLAAHFEGVKPPALGTAVDGMACPTVHDFSLVDQDQSDNVTTQYLVTGTGQTAEQGSGVTGMLVNNGSDNLLLDMFLDPALGCTGSEFAVPSLSDPGTTEATQATDELAASADQQAPAALMPPNDPMTTVGADDDIIAGDFPVAGNLSTVKTDLYRAELGQPLMGFNTVATATGYCTNLKAAGARVANDAQFETTTGSPGGVPLNQFMAARYATSLSLLNCALFAPAAASAVTPAPTPTDPPAAAPATEPSATTGP